MADQHFCLRWNNYQENLTRIFDQLLQNEALVDVTLYVGTHRIKAHKTILSACSPYFESMFVESTHPHPIVVLRDFAYEDIRGLLEFMYKGEVNVSQARLGTFLKVAEILQVRGLTTDSKKQSEKDDAEPLNMVVDGPVNPSRRKRHRSMGAEDSTHSIPNDFPSHPSPSLPHNSTSSVPFPLTTRTLSPPPLPHGFSDNQRPPLDSLHDTTDILKSAADTEVKTTDAPMQSQLDPIQPLDTSMSVDVKVPVTSDGAPPPDQRRAAEMEMAEMVKIEEEEYEEDDLLEQYPDTDFRDYPSTSQPPVGPPPLDESGSGLPLLSGIVPNMDGSETTSSNFVQTRWTGSYFYHTSDGRKVCRICGKSGRYLSRHIHKHFPKRFCCHLCNKLFHRKDNLKAHLYGVHKEVPF